MQPTRAIGRTMDMQMGNGVVMLFCMIVSQPSLPPHGVLCTCVCVCICICVPLSVYPNTWS